MFVFFINAVAVYVFLCLKSIQWFKVNLISSFTVTTRQEDPALEKIT